jgi:hypothetical protein
VIVMGSSSEVAAVRWLVAQSIAFGITAALLGVVANAMFLDAYGSSWLPVTYVFIGLAGLLVSGSVARSVRTASLERVATSVLGGATVTFVAAWLIAVGAGGAWVSAPLLVLFPVLIQLGFVFIGGQAGRILDIGGIKASFPRIMAGFPLGAIVGGLAAGGLVTLLGRTEHLLLATAIAQGAFLGLLLVTGRRFASATAPAAPMSSPKSPHPRRTPASALVVVIFSYQVLSAVGSQLADFLVFDRAAARYGDGEELARFIARYTALMNIVSITFLALVAGVLLRRFGLRLGLLANPGVLTIFTVAMVVASVTAGSGSLALFSVVAFARIADIALTDGTTRTSINAAYQVLPGDERLAVQTKVEGVGVPLAIGFSGVLVLVLDALPFAVSALVIATLIVCAVWTVVAALVHRGYVTTLVDALDRRWMDDDDSLRTDEDEQAAARKLLTANDGREVRLGLDLLSAMSSPAPMVELDRLSQDPRADVRMAALARMAADGDVDARRRLAVDVKAGSTAQDADVRRAAARALPHVDGDAHRLLAQFLRDEDPRVRHDALQSVGPRDVDMVGAAIDALGDADVPVPAATLRLVRALRSADAVAVSNVLLPHLRHRDREFGLAVLQALAQPEPALEPLATHVRAVVDDDIRIAGSLCAATASFGAGAVIVRRALQDELDLIRRRIAAALAVLHGSVRLGSALRALDCGGRASRALAVETIEVTLPRGEASRALAVLRPDLTAERSTQPGLPVPEAPPNGWLVDLVKDPDDRWRSPWLRTCAAYAARRQGIDLQLDGTIVDADLQEVLELTPPAPRGKSGEFTG